MSAADEVLALARDARRLARDGAVGGITVLCWAARLERIALDVRRAERTADELYSVAMEQEREFAERAAARAAAIAAGEVAELLPRCPGSHRGGAA